MHAYISQGCKEEMVHNFARWRGGGRAGIFQSHKKFSHDILRLSLKDVRFAHCRLIKLNQNEILYEIFIASYL